MTALKHVLRRLRGNCQGTSFNLLAASPVRPHLPTHSEKNNRPQILRRPSCRDFKEGSISGLNSGGVEVEGYSLLTNRCKVFSQGTAALRTATGVSGELSHKAKLSKRFEGG